MSTGGNPPVKKTVPVQAANSMGIASTTTATAVKQTQPTLARPTTVRNVAPSTPLSGNNNNNDAGGSQSHSTSPQGMDPNEFNQPPPQEAIALAVATTLESFWKKMQTEQEEAQHRLSKTLMEAVDRQISRRMSEVAHPAPPAVPERTEEVPVSPVPKAEGVPNPRTMFASTPRYGAEPWYDRTEVVSRLDDDSEEAKERRELRNVKTRDYPVYKGDPSEVLENWVYDMTKWFRSRIVEYPHNQVTLAVNALQGSAKVWHQLREDMERQGQRQPLQSFQELVNELGEAFPQGDIGLQLRDELRMLKMDKDVIDYITKFQEIILRIRDMGEYDRLSYFYSGLSDYLRKEVHKVRPKTLAEACSLAIQYANSKKLMDSVSRNANKSEATGGNGGRNGRHRGSSGNGNSKPEQATEKKIVCHLCGVEGHKKPNCPQRPKSAQKPKEEGQKKQGNA